MCERESEGIISYYFQTQMSSEQKRIRGVVRIRPLKSTEGDNIISIENDSTTTSQLIVTNNVSLASGRTATSKSKYQFDACYGPNTNQHDFFQQEVEPHLNITLSGHTATFFCYGMTGTGKSYTMQGSPDNRGIIPRVVAAMLAKLTPLEDAELSMSYLELYNERVFDLLVII